MKIDTITVTERKNKGNYEHIEISASAKVEEGEDAFSAMLTLKTYVATALMENLPIKQEEKPLEVVKVNNVNGEEVPVLSDGTSPKTKKAKKTKVEVVEETQQEVPPVIEAPKKKEPKVVVYDSTIPEHKSVFAAYLSKKYDTKWKTVAAPEEIKKFTASLNGQPFLDDSGDILAVFLEQVHTFFGM